MPVQSFRFFRDKFRLLSRELTAALHKVAGLIGRAVRHVISFTVETAQLTRRIPPSNTGMAEAAPRLPDPFRSHVLRGLSAVRPTSEPVCCLFSPRLSWDEPRSL